MKNPLIPAGIEPATYRFVAQLLNHCATAVVSGAVMKLSLCIWELQAQLYSFLSREEIPCIQWTVGWASSVSSRVVLEKRKFSFTCRESNTVLASCSPQARTHTVGLEVCHPRCVVYNNVLTCRTLYLVNSTVFIYLCVIQHYMFRPSMWPSSGVSRNYLYKVHGRWGGWRVGARDLEPQPTTHHHIEGRNMQCCITQRQINTVELTKYSVLHVHTLPYSRSSGFV